MAKRFGVVGCGYVGTAVALHLRKQGYELMGTTTGPSRLAELFDTVDHPRILCAGDPGADFSVLDDLDGLLIAMAPTTVSYEEDQYRVVYGEAVPALVEALRKRSREQPLHISYLSSAGVYGDQSGTITTELSPPDLSNTTNALLVQAEDAVLSLNTPLIQTCVLRLGGIYGPGKDIPSFIRSASGQQIPKNGNHINAWVHLDDIVRGVDFSLQRRLQGIYNLVDDLQLTRRELSNALCDEEGLPPVIWENHDRPGARVFNARVSNARLLQMGFSLRTRSMLEPVAQLS